MADDAARTESDNGGDTREPTAPTRDTFAEPGTGAHGPDIGDMLLQLVPFTRTLGLSFDETTAQRSVVHLRSQPEFSNHLGGPHAGAIFTAAETASGAVTLAAFGAPRPEATPVVARARIEFQKFAASDVTAIAHLTSDRDAALAELAAGRRPEFDVEVDCYCGDVLVTRVVLTWTLINTRR